MSGLYTVVGFLVVWGVLVTLLIVGLVTIIRAWQAIEVPTPPVTPAKPMSDWFDQFIGEARANMIAKAEEYPVRREGPARERRLFDVD